jgi:hypothetical protein
MPYFKDIDILFIHIPHTNTNCIELYLSKKYNIILNKDTLYNLIYNNALFNNNLLFHNHLLQHLTYLQLYNYKNELKIDFNNKLKIFSFVINPYIRILNDLYFFKYITIEMDKKDIEYNINEYITYNDMFCYLKIPQYKYLVNDNNELLNKDIIILKFENINEEMKNLGFEDFYYDNKNIIFKDYKKYLTDNSINIINNYYELDFSLFTYEKL